MQAPTPSDEAARLEALRQYEVLDTAPEPEFDDLAHLAAHICGTPISAITLLDEERQWFKSRVGIADIQTPRAASFCAHAILGDDILLVPDASQDERFADNPFVTAEPHVRFYAGVPLVTPAGQAIGALCVVDTIPRQLNGTQQDALRRLARQTMALLEARPDVTIPRAQSRQARLESERQQRALAEEKARVDEEHLRASEQRYRRLFEAAKDGILILDAASGRIENANPYLCQLLGYQAGDLVGRQLWEIGTFRDIAASQDAFRTLPQEEYIRYSDLPLEKKDGTSTCVEFVSNVYEEDGRQVIQCNIHDISERKQAASAQQELQRFLQSTLDALSSHVAVLDEDGKIIAVNKAWRQFAEENDGTAASCGVGANYIGVCDRASGTWAEEAPVLARGIRDIMRDAMATSQQAFCLEYPCHSPREERWFSVCVTRFGGDGPRRVVVAHEDITERKRAQNALLQMRDELEARVQERTTALAQSNADLQIQIAEREGAEAETRRRARQQEAVAELGRRALTDIDIDTLLSGATALVTATLNVELGTILEVLPGTDTLRIRAGSGWKADVIGRVLPGGTASKAGYSLLSNTPTIVSDLRTETRFTPPPLLLEQGIISGVTVIVGGFQQPFGTLGAHSTQQRRFTQDDVHFLQSMSNVLAAVLEQRSIQTEIRQLNEQLKETNEQLRIDNVERQMALGALREATQVLEQAKQEAEQARESAEHANRAKSEFLSRMSHELRTPLNAILGFGQILDKQVLTGVQRESVSYILKGGRHLLDLINEVLDLARVEAGHLELSLEPIALDDVVPEACALVRPLAAQRSIRLDADASQLSGSHILADRQRLKQVLINLLSNAIKYNRQGGHVQVSCELKLDGWTRITVRDSGVGLSREDMAKLFTPFERLGAANSEVEGTGLGLALSQRLVLQMGGTLQVESTPGVGSAFTIELPQAASPQQMANLPQDTDDLEPGTLYEQLYTVLCIEDNPSNLRLMEAIFEIRPDITLLAAVQGSVGLDLARQHEPDLILLDLNLPDIHGKEVLARLRQSAVTRDIPVVVVSADATTNQVERLMSAGAQAYLTKPLDVSQFLFTLDKFLQPRPAESQN